MAYYGSGKCLFGCEITIPFLEEVNCELNTGLAPSPKNFRREKKFRTNPKHDKILEQEMHQFNPTAPDDI